MKMENIQHFWNNKEKELGDLKYYKDMSLPIFIGLDTNTIDAVQVIYFPLIVYINLYNTMSNIWYHYVAFVY